MKSFKYIKSTALVIFSACLFTTSTVCIENVMAETASAVKKTSPAVQQVQQELKAAPLSIVASPKAYLNKNIVMNAKFDKFSTLGLDYKPAFKSSEEYISFLIKRDDTNFNIPLSEMKLFLKRSMAEKFIDLKTDDEIEIKGIVFSDALGDAWIDVKEIKVLKKAPETDKK